MGDTETDTLLQLVLEGRVELEMDTEGVPVTVATTEPEASAEPTPAKDTVFLTDTEVVLEMLGLGVDEELLEPVTVPVSVREVQVVADRVRGAVKVLATLPDPPCDTDVVKEGVGEVEGQGVGDLDPEGLPEASGEELHRGLEEGDWE